jgi:hypothetical protein
MSERKVEYRTYDLNIFWEEFYDKYLGTWWDDKLTIDVYEYEAGKDWSDRKNVGLTFKCTREESLAIVEHFKEEEYGHDWFVFIEEALPYFSDRIKKILAALPEIEQPNKEEIIMSETIEQVKYEPKTTKSINVIPVWEESFVPKDAMLQVGVTTHVRGGDDDRGIVNSVSFTLTTEEAVELIDELESGIAKNKRAENERQVIREFYESRSNVS